MRNLVSAIFASLREVDAEATARADGTLTGLSWYGGHFEPHQKRPRTEVAWSKRLAELLPLRSYPARSEVSYPSKPRLKCDDVITLPGGCPLWLEVKGAWKQWWEDQGGSWIYRSYLLHPLVARLDQNRTHTVPLDLKKLESLKPPHAAYVGMLLVGFEKEGNSMDGDIAELVRFAGLDRSPWTAEHDRWPEMCRPQYHVRCFLWHRPA